MNGDKGILRSLGSFGLMCVKHDGEMCFDAYAVMMSKGLITEVKSAEEVCSKLDNGLEWEEECTSTPCCYWSVGRCLSSQGGQPCYSLPEVVLHAFTLPYSTACACTHNVMTKFFSRTHAHAQSHDHFHPFRVSLVADGFDVRLLHPQGLENGAPLDDAAGIGDYVGWAGERAWYVEHA